MRRVVGPQTLAVIFVTMLALLFTACSPADSRITPGPEGKSGEKLSENPYTAQGKRGGTFVRSAGRDSRSGTDPAMGQMSYVIWPQVGGMMLFRHANTWEILPGILESWEISKDGLEYTFHVRKGVKFPNMAPVNGREVEARDIVYTIKGNYGMLYPDLPPVRFPRRANYEPMVDAVAVDKHTVKVTLAKPSSDFLDAIQEYRGATVLPEGIREFFGGVEALAEPSVERYVSPGPFLMTKFQQQVEVEYVRNPDYWDQPRPWVDKMREIWIPDTSTEMAAFIAGQVDYVAPSGDDERDFVLSGKKDARVWSYDPGSCWYRLTFNLERKPFDDYRVRRAVALVMDHVQYGKQFKGDWEGKPLWRYPGPLPYVFPESLTQEELAAHPLYKGPTPENVAEAQRLLKEAGYGNGFSAEMMTTRSGMADLAQMMVADFEKHLPGVKIKIDPVDNAINHQRSAKKLFDMQNYCYIHEPTAVGMLKTAYHTKGGRNFSGYSSPKVDELLDQATVEMDKAKRTQLLRRAQQVILDEGLSMMPTYHGQSQWVAQPWVKNLVLGPAWRDYASFHYLWLDNPPNR